MHRSFRLAPFAVLAAVVVGCDDELGPEVAERYVASLNGTNESPDVTTTATGTAEFTVLNGVPGIYFRLDVAGINNVTAAHIHAPAPAEQNIGVVVNLYTGGNTGANVTGTLAEGVISSATGMTLDSLRVLMGNGNAYVNVHTTVNGGGEIRGQITRQ